MENKMRKTSFLTVLIGLIGFSTLANAQLTGHRMPHEMQHGFVLSADDKFASHLVASGHHSRQVEILGLLTIEDPIEAKLYEERKSLSGGNSYFLFQAQKLDLPSIAAGQVLTGHIVESKTGLYEPRNIIIKKAKYTVDRVLLSVENPFFLEP
jgi:hypothetical protein